MRSYSSDLKIADAPAYEIPQKMQKGVLTTPFIILLLCMVPDIPYLAILKPPIAVILLFLTFSAVLAAFAHKIRVPGRNIFIILILVTVFNIFNVLFYHGPVLRWMRMAFCPYIFAAMFFFIVQRIDTPDLRNRLWRMLVYFISFASFLDFIGVARHGLAATFNARGAGGHTFTVTALMLLFPIFGYALVKKKLLLFLFFANLFLLLLSASRGVYLMIFMGTLYTLIFIQKRFTYRMFFVLFILIVGGVIVSTPIYDRMAQRFSAAAGGEDTSVLRRMHETKDSIADAYKTWPTFLFGKGYGTLWKVSVGGDLPGGYMAEAPHNDYSAKILYTGLLGFTVQLLLYFVIGFTCISALRRSRRVEIDVDTKLRLHGALLVLLFAMIAWGFAGAVSLSFNNNVYQAVIIGMAMADAKDILSGKRIQVRKHQEMIIKKGSF
jgi:O-Antigen ligase